MGGFELFHYIITPLRIHLFDPRHSGSQQRTSTSPRKSNEKNSEPFGALRHPYRTHSANFRITTIQTRSAKPKYAVDTAEILTGKDGVRKETRSYRQEASKEMAQTSVRHIHVCTFSMEETKGYRQQSAKTVQGSNGHAFGML